MSFLSRLFRRAPNLPTLMHPIFGKIEATIDFGSGTYFWETPDSLVTPKGDLGIFFDAPESGPSQQQLALWQLIYNDIEFFTKKCEPMVREELANIRIENQYEALVWSGVGLSSDGNPSTRWDISFTTPDGAIVTAHFEHGEPTIVTFDD